jgi:hypothetical protein
MISLENDKLIIHLRGSNALQVEGAAYEIEANEGFVKDILDNPSPPIQYTEDKNNAVSPSIDGFKVSKPFVRVSRKQETIARRDGSAVNPEYYLTSQPFTADLQMDSRTPGSTIIWRARYKVTSVDATNYGNIQALVVPNEPPSPDDTNPSGNATIGFVVDFDSNTRNKVTIPTTPAEQEGGTNQYQGYQFRVFAWAEKGSDRSEPTQDMAWRSVVTYLINGYDNAGANGLGQTLQTGDQVWIRGGNTLTTSDIPGYPLTWEDDFSVLAEPGNTQRAGIRLMQKTGNGNLNTGSAANIWRWVTWGVTTRTYIGFFLGRSGLGGYAPPGDVTAEGDVDTVVRANRIWKYGPHIFSSQRGGWTNFKQRFPLYPGGHTYMSMTCDNSTDTPCFVLNMITRPANLTPPVSQE